MKLPKALLGAILVGVAVQSTSCIKKDDPAPKEGQQKGGKSAPPVNCPACGLG